MIRSSMIPRATILLFCFSLSTALLSTGCEYYGCGDGDHDDDDWSDCRGPYCDDPPRDDAGAPTRDSSISYPDLGSVDVDAALESDGGPIGTADAAIEADAGAPPIDFGPPPFCASDTDCAEGSVCRAGVCRTLCPTGTDIECRRYDAQLVICRAVAGENLCFTAGE
jgi:Cys-rich repeat protein